MSNSILILGESGTGKSTSIRTLPADETFVINVINKPLPFRGWKAKYKRLTENGKEGNFYETDDSMRILKVLRHVDENRPEIKYIVIDDFGYTITNSFMRKSNQKGYEKYTEIGKDAFCVLDAVSNLREDLYCFVTMHVELDAANRFKPKTIGKMIDQHVNIEGKFTCVLFSLHTDGGYQFMTNTDGMHIAKTPMGMFEEQYVDNDLLVITKKMHEYYNQDIPQ